MLWHKIFISHSTFVKEIKYAPQMKNLFRRKSALQLKQERYAELMRKSYDVALKDPGKSDKVKFQANKIFKDIQILSLESVL